MKRVPFFVAIAIAFLFACNNKDKQSTTRGPFFYKRFEGTIGNKHVVLHLNRDSNAYTGSYYSDGYWLDLRTDTLIGKDSIILFENAYNDYYWDKEQQPRLALKWVGEELKGNWLSTTRDTVLAVTLKETYPDGATRFKIARMADSLEAFKEKKGSPKGRFSYWFPQSENGELDKAIISAVKFRAPAENWQKGMTLERDTFFKEYEDAASTEKYYNADSVGGGYLSYSNNTKGNIRYNDKGFVVIDQFRDSYTGGAHGYYYSTMLCFDVKNVKQMKLSDVITADSVTLQGIVETWLRNNYNVKPNEPLTKVLFDNHLPANKNFYFNNNGLAFIYNPYEVASYAQGQIQVFIPFPALKKYLVPEFAARMGLK